MSGCPTNDSEKRTVFEVEVEVTGIPDLDLRHLVYEIVDITVDEAPERRSTRGNLLPDNTRTTPPGPGRPHTPSKLSSLPAPIDGMRNLNVQVRLMIDPIPAEGILPLQRFADRVNAELDFTDTPFGLFAEMLLDWRKGWASASDLAELMQLVDQYGTAPDAAA